MSTPLFSDKVAVPIAIGIVKVDDFCNLFEDEFKKQSLPTPKGIKKRNRKATLSDSEVITILIAFHGGQFRNFKHFYCHYVCVHLRDCFPDVVSYNRFIELSHRSAIPFMMFLHYCCRGECTGISFIDSTVLRVCHGKRIKTQVRGRSTCQVPPASRASRHGYRAGSAPLATTGFPPPRE